jgi:hypothetical protein
MPWSLCSHSWNSLNCFERMRIDNMTSQIDDQTQVRNIHNLSNFNQIEIFEF